MIKIAKDLSLPVELTTQTVAILAKRRSGKSYTMRRITEQLLKAEQQVVVVDPKGDQWGIRSSADGKGPGYPVVIFGGEHGDVPLEVGAGELVAKIVVEERVSILVDLSMFRKHEVATFMTAFMENLYRLKAQEKHRTPVMLVMDEADAIAPQKPQKGEERMLGAAEDIVRRGGQRGIGCILVTQRSAVLNKNVLTQAEMLVVLRTISPQDLAAMNAWIDVHGEPEQKKILMDSLPALPIGDAWFWSPGWPTSEGIFKRTRALPIETFDSGATPKPGEKRVVPKNLADVDLETLRGQMAATIEKAKSEDPKELKKEIARLKREIETAEVHPKRLTVPVLKDSQITRLEKVAERMSQEAQRHGEAMALLWGNFNEVGTFLAAALDSVRTLRVQSNLVVPEVSRDPRQKFEPVTVGGLTVLSKGARSVLSYLHQVYPHWKSKAQLWIATGYAPGGGFNNIIYELTGAGLIEKDGTGKYASLGKHGSSLVDEPFDTSLSKWDSKLSLGARKIFALLLQNPAVAFSKEYIAQETGYALGGGFNNLIYELTGKELIEKVGTEYRLNPEVLELD